MHGTEVADRGEQIIIALVPTADLVERTLKLEPQIHQARELEEYDRCPRKYAYSRSLGLHALGDFDIWGVEPNPAARERLVELPARTWLPRPCAPRRPPVA